MSRNYHIGIESQVLEEIKDFSSISIYVFKRVV